jgi:hypothetical protein
MRSAVVLVILVTVVAPAATARAEDDRRAPPWAIRFEPGVVMTSEHMHDYGAGVGVAPPVYIGASIERAIAGPLRANISGGASVLLGWLVGGTVRYAAYDTDAVALSIGAGPLFAPDAQFGAATFAQIDAAVQARITGGFGFFLGLGAGVALNHARARDCGVDTCRAYLERGDVTGSVRAGVGFAF